MADVKTNYPVNDENNIYIESYYEPSLTDIVNIINKNWGSDVNFDDVKIEAEHRHVRCLGYDLYDSGDYETYIHISRE